MTQNRVYGTQLISRVFLILRQFTPQQTELTLTEVSILVGLHVTTTHRILKALLNEGVLTKDAKTGKYRLGQGLIRLGELAKRSNDLVRIAIRPAEKLAERWGETTLVDTMNRDFEVETLLTIPSTYRVAINPSYGKRIPPHCIAAGKILLAYLSPERLKEYLKQDLVSFTPATITKIERLAEELAIIREQGYATNIEEHEIGFSALAAPIFDASGQVVAAVSIGGPTIRLGEEKFPLLIDSIIESAKAISAELGSIQEAEKPG